MNELSVSEQETILALLRLGWSIRRVARETGRRHETIRRYGQQAGVLPAAVALSKPQTPAKVPTDPPAKPHSAKIEVPTDPVADAALVAIEGPTPSSGQNAAVAVKRDRSSCREHAAFIEAELAKGRNATAIYQDLVEHHGYAGSYDAVKRFARR